MSVLWQKSLSGSDPWQASTIRGLAELGELDSASPYWLVRVGQGGDAIAVLLARLDQPVYVNGQSAIGGLVVLQHRDEILVGARRYYYSAESRPTVSTFHLTGGRRPKCGVCRSAIDDGQEVVICPRCGRVFHQIAAAEDRPAKECWTYHDKCLCDHPTALGEDATWRPEKEACCV